VKAATTYAEWLVNPDHRRFLTRAELRKLQADAEWVKENPEQAAELEALIGKTVALVRTFNTIAASSDFCAEEPARDRAPKVHRRGARFEVILRLFDEVLARGEDNTVLLLKPDWIREVSDAKDRAGA
jgi:hypothetical protein